MRKALENISNQLGLPLAAPDIDPSTQDDAYLMIGGILWGPGNPELEKQLNQLATAKAEDKPEHIHHLGAIADSRVEGVLRWALTTSSDPGVRGAAAFELAQSTSTDSHTALVKALSDQDEMVRDQARTAIEQIGGFKMEPLLRTAMHSPNDNEAMEAGDLLERAFGLQVEPDFWTRFTSK
jgi:HEAT repeat protein